MARNWRTKHRKDKARPARNEDSAPPEAMSPLHRKPDPAPLKPRTEAQGRYLHSIHNNKLTFGLGVAGTGKTFIAGSVAADMLRRGDVTRLIFTRPAVESGERIGFLPGTMAEKFEPYFRPYKEVLARRLGSGALEYGLRNGTIEASPLNFLRGWTFEDCVVVLDEAQNCTMTEMKLFLTRIGENCKIVVSGDPSPYQKDIDGQSGLMDAVTRCRSLHGVGVVYFTRADVVRSGLVQQIVEAYDEPASEEEDAEGLRRVLGKGGDDGIATGCT